MTRSGLGNVEHPTNKAMTSGPKKPTLDPNLITFLGKNPEPSGGIFSWIKMTMFNGSKHDCERILGSDGDDWTNLQILMILIEM